VPTATTRTWIPVAVVNIGMRWENRPEFSVEVVEARTMNRSLAWSGLASSAPRGERWQSGVESSGVSGQGLE
jgi:hypothetical protein